MDIDRNKRRQSLKIIISEAVMVIAVIFMVVILAFIVSGYWVGSDFTIERQGMLQVRSVPTGATVSIDDETSWMQKTNTSKVLSSGEHSIVLSRDDYDSWSKTINISEGLLYRLNYPRLFLKERKVEKALELVGTTQAFYSPNHETMLLIGGTTKWSLTNLTNENLEPKVYDTSSFFPNFTVENKILDSSWSNNGSFVLLKVSTSAGVEWILANLKNPAESLNLTRSFGYDFDSVQIIDDSANTLLATESHNLRKINVSNRSISSVLVAGVYDYDYYNNEVVFSNHDATLDVYQIGLLNINSENPTILDNELTSSARVVISKFYDDNFIAVLDGQVVSLYHKDDYSLYNTFELSFVPNQIKVGFDGDFILFNTDNNLATVDLEASAVREWQIESNSFGWIDSHMIYVIADNQLVVYDYDGLNRRILSSNVSAKFPVTITADKWLYYFSDGNLMREWLIPR